MSLQSTGCGEFFHISSSWMVSHEWIISFVFKWLASVNFLSHFKQPNGFEWFLISVDSFVGLQMTCLYELLITLWAAERFLISINPFMSLYDPLKLWSGLNFFEQTEQLNGFLSVWILSCEIKSVFCVHLLEYWEQLNDLSPVWTLSCILVLGG